MHMHMQTYAYLGGTDRYWLSTIFITTHIFISNLTPYDPDLPF
jgi:hypothetical protein